MPILQYIHSLARPEWNCNFSDTAILLSKVHPNAKHPMKYDIYVHRCLSKNIYINGFENYCKNHIQIKKLVVIRSNKLSLHIA